MPQLRSAVRMPRTGTSATPIMSEADFASKMKSVKELASDLENDLLPASEDGSTSCAGQHKHNKSLIEELLSRSLDELDARSPGGRIATRISEDLPPDVLFQVSPSRHNFANVKFSLPSAVLGGNANAGVGISAAKRPGPSSASSSALQQKTNLVSTKAYKAADMATIPENESSTTVDENYSASGTSASSKESGAMSPEEELCQYHFPAETAVAAGGTAARVRSKSQPQRFAREAGCPPSQEVEQLQRALPRYDLEAIGQEFCCDEEDVALVHAGQSSQFPSNLSTKSTSAASVKLAPSMAASFTSAVSCKRIDDNEPHALVVNQVADVPFRPVSVSLRSAAVTGKANIAKAIAPSKPPALQIPRAPKVPGATTSAGTTTANPKKPPTSSFIKAVVIDDAVSGTPASQFFPEQKIVHLGRGKPSQQATDHGGQLQSSPGFAQEIRASPNGASHASASSSGAGRAPSVSSSAAAGGNGKRKKKKSLRKKGSSPVDMALAEEALLSAERFIRECRTGRMHHHMTTHAASYSGGALRTLSAMNSAEEDRRFEQLYWQSAQKLGIPRSESAPRIGVHLADRSRQVAATSRPPPPIAFGSALPPPSSAPVRAASTKSRKSKSASRTGGAGAAGTKKKKKKGSGKHNETTMTGLKRSQYNLAMLRRGMIRNTNDRLMASPGSVDGSVARISAAPSANDAPANMHFAPVEARHDAGLVSSKSVPAFQPNSRRMTSKPQPQQFGGVTLNTSKETVCSTRAGTSRTASKDFSSDDANLAKAAASPDSSSSTGVGGMLKQRGVPAKRNILTATTTGPASISPNTLSAPQQSKSFQPAPRGKTALRVVMPSTGTPAKSSHAPQEEEEPKAKNEPATEETIFFGDHEYRRVRRPADGAIRSTRKPLFDSGLAVAPPPRRSKSLGQFSSYGPTSASSVTASLYQTGTLPRPAHARRDLQRSHAKVTTTATTSTSTANKKRSTAAADERENVFSYAGPHRMEILELDRRRERMRDIILAPRTVADAVDHQEPNLRRGSGAGSSASASRTRPGRKASVSDDGIVDESPTTASATAEVMYELKKPDYRRSASAGTLRSGAQHRFERRRQGSPRSRFGKPASPPPGETRGFSSGRSGTRSKLRIVSPRERSASPERAAFIEEMRQEKQRLQSDHKNMTSLREMEKMVDETHDLLLKRGMLKKGSSARASSGQIPQRAEKERRAADSESDSEFDADAGSRKRGEDARRATSLNLLPARKPAHDVRRRAARALGPDIEFLWEYDAEDDLPPGRSASAGSSSSTARGIAPRPARRQNSLRGRSRGSSKDVDDDDDEDRKMELVSELDFSFEDLASLEKQETTCLEDIDRAIEELQKQLETIDQD